jgi:phosphoribosylanthranilate isomerase
MTSTSSSPPRVKVCGITRAKDAALAVELGAIALGFIFWPHSPRAVSAAQVGEIARGLPPFVSLVGVFVNQPVDEVLATARAAGLTGIQLHGDEDAAAYAAEGLRLVKAVPVPEAFTADALTAIPSDVTVLLDAHDPVRRGGTGRTIDWTRAAEAARLRPIILSGGLTPENIRTAVRTVRPYGVDVSSGVESAPGVKDESRLRSLFAALRSESVEHA